PETLKEKQRAGKNRYPAEPPRRSGGPEYKDAGGHHEDAPEHVAYAVDREGGQIQRVGQTVIMLGAVASDFSSKHAGYSDITHGMQGHEKDAADKYEGREPARPLGALIEQVMQSPQIDQKSDSVDDRQTRHHN